MLYFESCTLLNSGQRCDKSGREKLKVELSVIIATDVFVTFLAPAFCLAHHDSQYFEHPHRKL